MLNADGSLNTPPIWQDISAAAEGALADLHLAGLSIGVVHGSDIPYAAGFGYADIRADAPVTADSLFHTTSISKLFAATALMHLSCACNQGQAEEHAQRGLQFYFTSLTAEHLEDTESEQHCPFLLILFSALPIFSKRGVIYE